MLALLNQTLAIAGLAMGLVTVFRGSVSIVSLDFLKTDLRIYTLLVGLAITFSGAFITAICLNYLHLLPR